LQLLVLLKNSQLPQLGFNYNQFHDQEKDSPQVLLLSTELYCHMLNYLKLSQALLLDILGQLLQLLVMLQLTLY
jgi:hypothetical protein